MLLQQVFLNLFENIAKYTPPGSTVDIAARREENRVAITIADRGPGVPPGEEERVFEKFHRGAHVGISGAGLGLAICRGIVEAHGGAISVANRPGGGALLRIDLPLLDDAPEPEAEVRRD